LREINLTPEMSMSPSRTVAQNTAQGTEGSTSVVRTGGSAPFVSPKDDGTGAPALPPRTNPGAAAGTPLVAGPDVPGRSRVTDSGDGGLLDEHRQRMEILFGQLRQKGLDVQRDAAEKFRTGQHDLALEMLQDYLNDLTDKQLDAGKVSLLRRPVESRLNHF